MRPEEEGRWILQEIAVQQEVYVPHIASLLYPQGNLTGCRTGNGEKLSSSQAEPGQAIKSAVA